MLRASLHEVRFRCVNRDVKRCVDQVDVWIGVWRRWLCGSGNVWKWGDARSYRRWHGSPLLGMQVNCAVPPRGQILPNKFDLRPCHPSPLVPPYVSLPLYSGAPFCMCRCPRRSSMLGPPRPSSPASHPLRTARTRRPSQRRQPLLTVSRRPLRQPPDPPARCPLVQSAGPSMLKAVCLRPDCRTAMPR